MPHPRPSLPHSRSRSCRPSSPAPLRAQDYPTRPVRVVVGFGPGASGDIAARVLSQRLGQVLGQQFIVENRTGAASNIATNYVAKAPKDGYTLLQGTVANTISAALTPNLPYDLTKDFVPVSLFATVPNLVVVHPSVGVKTIAELIKLARDKPDGFAFGSAGVGSGSHFSGELFNVMAGIKLIHVPYPGTAQAVTDLLAGRVQVVFSPASSALQFVEEGKIIALASTRVEARERRPRPADRLRIRAARLRHLGLVRHVGAHGRAARHHRAARRRDTGSGEVARCLRTPAATGHGRGVRHRRRNSRPTSPPTWPNGRAPPRARARQAVSEFTPAAPRKLADRQMFRSRSCDFRHGKVLDPVVATGCIA